MTFGSKLRLGILGLTVLAVGACGGRISSGDSGLFRSRDKAPEERARPQPDEDRRDTIWTLFDNADDPNSTIEVNKYLWNASLEILNFLPIRSVDPFSGVIVTGYGTPPGGGTAYRATILVQDPALDARSLKVSLSTRRGAVSTATVRAVEDAILTRARQLRIRDGDL
ncbi:hypothetical protein ACMU_02870 [Actibacterium mucosum KCTC 23349]|uniref:DUF3576 domain-containing protein n=1 Tax=Actibacterium mucosum KCTC 23349 TaxID=1454373 RepID=A0A037ZN11_9RHOB|nr:DUF3576 domain-containing protein [Actibacterium mucosum]KAJ57464.1 hypothetical protein ACMU_02870 [Actibacterium mucosum KCTC 23349]